MPIDDKERERRRALLRRHIEAENAGDMPTVMETFAENGVMHYNGAAFPTGETILAAHEYLGFSRPMGAFADATNFIDRESFTDADIVVEGRMCGVHRGEFMGFAPTGRRVELPFVAFYCFGEDGRLTSERVVMDLGRLQKTTAT